MEKQGESTTSIMITLDLQGNREGLSLGELHSLIQKVLDTHALTKYRIYHDPKGLVVVGSY